jgi:nitronate monooxygenase
MMIQTRLTERFDLSHPIVLAPMALASGGALAAAVSRAGGLGLVGGGYCDADWVMRELDAAGNQRVGCGFITWKLAETPDLLPRVLDRDPQAVFLSFGDPRPFGAEIAASGVPLICQIQTLADARLALEAGAAVIVAQGSEAGGHGDARGTLPLVPEIADLVAREAPETLVLAAGGIADGRGLAAALMLGADGALVGSRFWASAESLAHPAMVAAALQADGDATRRSSVADIARRIAWPERFTLRALRNPFFDRWHGELDALRAVSETEAARYIDAAERGDPTIAATIVGEVAGLIHDRPPAAEILARMSAEAETLLNGGWRMGGRG